MAVLKTAIYIGMFAMCISICYLIVFVTNKLPGQHGVIHVNRDSGNATIYRLLDGIPHVHADSLDMGAYGLGFAMTADRVFQMDKLRRLSQGRLSEIFGEKTIPIDQAARNFGFKDVSHMIYNGLDQETKNYFQNFSSGVNNYLEYFSVGIEYWLLGIEFETWTPEDSISIFVFTSFMLSDGFKSELYREYLYSKLNNTALVDMIMPFDQDKESNISKPVLNDEELKQAGLFQEYTENEPRASFRAKLFDFIENNADEELSVIKDIVNIYSSGDGASNCWTVSGDHTKSGKPILVNDPHLNPSLPSPFYMAELNIQDEYFVGAIFPGLPIFASFRSNNIAIGVTSLMADNSDLFEETVNGTSYLSKGVWEDLIIREEIIKVKGYTEPVKILIRSTHHGPILDYAGTLFTQVSQLQAPLKVKADVSLSWTTYYTGSNSLFNHYPKLWKVKTVKEVIDHIKGKPDSTFGICLADSSNNIGWIASTAFPIRPAGIKGGLTILDGASGEHDWKGFVPADEIPYIINPKKG